MSNERDKTSYHEAGHAVIARVLDVSVKRVMITGLAVMHDGCSPEVKAMVSLAGPAAELRQFPRLRNREGWSQDRAQAAMALSNRLGDLPAIERQARNLVEQHWRAIERVAQSLRDKRCLYQDEIDVLIAGDISVRQS
jgi:ATP-dependent Zn protease